MASVNAVIDVRGLPEVQEYIAELRRPIDPPPVGAAVLCMVCAQEKPWGVWSPKGVAVCIECRDKARGRT
jgi:hypothetical protein